MNAGSDIAVTYELLLAYKNLCTDFKNEDVDTLLQQIKNTTSHEISNEDALTLGRLAFKHGKICVFNIISTKQA